MITITYNKTYNIGNIIFKLRKSTNVLNGGSENATLVYTSDSLCANIVTNMDGDIFSVEIMDLSERFKSQILNRNLEVYQTNELTYIGNKEVNETDTFINNGFCQPGDSSLIINKLCSNIKIGLKKDKIDCLVVSNEFINDLHYSISIDRF